MRRSCVKSQGKSIAKSTSDGRRLLRAEFSADGARDMSSGDSDSEPAGEDVALLATDGVLSPSLFPPALSCCGRS